LRQETVTDKFLKDSETVDIRGSAIELIRKGNGSPLLFLHGMDGVEASAEIIDALARQFTVYAPSHPGFGTSELPAGVTTVDDLGYFYLDLLDQLDLRDVTLVGMSIGGWTALEMLVKDSSRIARAVLGAPLGLNTGDRRTQHVVDIFMLPTAEVEKKMQTTPPAPRIDPATLTAEAVERSVRNAEAVSLFGWSPYLHNPKLRQRLHRVKPPVLVLWGDADAIVSQEYRQAFVEALPGATFQILSECGHRIPTDCAEPAARAITDFAGAQSAAAAA
jgi:pimeloyl-ACP methyl ester carboxylesterase